MKKQFEVMIEVDEQDYEICDKYGFAFSRNLEEMIKDVAKELRKAETNNIVEFPGR